MRIAVNTGGGDAPGLNAVIRAVTLSALKNDWEVFGIRRGYGGLLEDDEGVGVVPLDGGRVRGITHLGGTILGTTNRGNPFEWLNHENNSIVVFDHGNRGCGQRPIGLVKPHSDRRGNR